MNISMCSNHTAIQDILAAKKTIKNRAARPPDLVRPIAKAQNECRSPIISADMRYVGSPPADVVVSPRIMSPAYVSSPSTPCSPESNYPHESIYLRMTSPAMRKYAKLAGKTTCNHLEFYCTQGHVYYAHVTNFMPEATDSAIIGKLSCPTCNMAGPAADVRKAVDEIFACKHNIIKMPFDKTPQPIKGSLAVDLVKKGISLGYIYHAEGSPVLIVQSTGRYINAAMDVINIRPGAFDPVEALNLNGTISTDSYEKIRLYAIKAHYNTL